MRILLARHGQSEWNATGRWQGRADPPLSELGRLQARAAAQALGAFDAIAASTLQRAAETAAIIAEALGVGPVLVDADLVERDAGPWTGLTRREIEDGWPGFLATDERPPGYEADDALVARVREALVRLESTVGDAEALVVAHGGVILALETSFGEAIERIPNLGGRWFGVDDGRLSLGERVVLIDHDFVTEQARDQL